MMTKCIIFTILAVSAVNAGIIPAAVVAPYASSYNAHTINHAIAAPIAAAPLVAAAPAASYVSAPIAAPAVAYVSSPYIASPYYAAPYVF